MSPLWPLLIAAFAAAQGPQIIIMAPKGANPAGAADCGFPESRFSQLQREAGILRGERPELSEIEAEAAVWTQYCRVKATLDSLESEAAPDPAERLKQIDALGPTFVKLRTDNPRGWALLKKDSDPAGLAPAQIQRIIGKAMVDEAKTRGELAQRRYAEAQLKLGQDRAVATAADWSFDKSAARPTLSLADFAPGGRYDVSGRAPAPYRPGAGRGFRTADVPLQSFQALTDGIDFDGPDRVPFLGIFSRENPAKAAFQQALKYLYDIPTGRETLDDVQRMRDFYGAKFERRARDIEAKPEAQRTDLDKQFLAAAAKDPKPHVLVSLGNAGPLSGGFAQTSIDLLPDGRFASRIVLKDKLLADGNPSRAVDKVLSHELRHQADKATMEEQPRGVTLQMFEDRAYLTDARAVTEQLPRMKNEPPSRTVEAIYDTDVKPMKKDPAFFGTHRMATALYLWNIEGADLSDPRAALRFRLATAFDLIWKAQRRGNLAAVLARIDRTHELMAVYRGLRSGVDDYEVRQALFIEEAQNTNFARRWLESLASAGKAGMAPDVRSGEEEYWSTLAQFSRL